MVSGLGGGWGGVGWGGRGENSIYLQFAGLLLTLDWEFCEQNAPMMISPINPAYSLLVKLNESAFTYSAPSVVKYIN